jgi:hypothetical protein
VMPVERIGFMLMVSVLSLSILAANKYIPLTILG